MKRPIYIELIGPAGAGKTTLIKSLLDTSGNFSICPKPSIRSPKFSSFFLKNFVNLWPILLPGIFGKNKFSYKVIWWLIYLNGWSERLQIENAENDEILLIDHGPIYMLTSLVYDGLIVDEGNKFEQWWGSTLEKWTSFLDIVIWLDASNEVLAQRIKNRPSEHLVKDMNSEDVISFLTNYRSSFEQVIYQSRNFEEKFKIFRFQTNQDTVHQIREKILSQILQ